MKRVILLHSDPDKVGPHIRELKKTGYNVELQSVSPQALRALRENPPAAVIIDLTRAPSQGRDIGIYIRHHKTTRKVAVVFVSGEPEKVARIKRHLPDATFARWRGIKSALRHAIQSPPAVPIAPKSLLAGYSTTPLAKKLGIKPESIVVLIDAPRNIEKILFNLPKGVMLKRRFIKNNDMMIWFVRSQKDMKARIRQMFPKVGNGGLWIVWPKKVSRIPSDLSQDIVRRIGLSVGLVDYKVCAVDETWAGLKFARRR
jgi:hypothetical protein